MVNIGWICILIYCIITAFCQETSNTSTDVTTAVSVNVTDVSVWLEDTDVNATEPSSNGTVVNGTDLADGPRVKQPPTLSETVIKYIGYVTVPIFLVMSLTGNVITIIVMLTKEFRKSPFSILLIALAVSDSTYSFIFLFSKLFFREFIGYDLRALSDIGCHFFFIVHKAFKIDSSWFIVAIAIERFIAVWFPLKASIICSRRNTRIVVIIIYIGMFVFTGLWSFSTKVVNGTCVPNYPTPETAVLTKAYVIAGSLMYSLIPAIILLILTPATCIQLAYQLRLRRRLAANVVAEPGRSKEDRINAMLIGVSVAYIVLVTPTSVAHNICFSLGISFYETRLPAMAIARGILQVMEQLNFSINFWLYVMCNISFRRRALEIFCCKTLACRTGSKYSRDSREQQINKTANTTDTDLSCREYTDQHI